MQRIENYYKMCYTTLLDIQKSENRRVITEQYLDDFNHLAFCFYQYDLCVPKNFIFENLGKPLMNSC